MLSKSIICWWQFFSRLIGGCSQFIPHLDMLMVSVLFFKKASANLVEILTASVIVIEFNFPNSLNVSRFFRRTLYAVFFLTIVKR
jgi:hypothetical protein